MKTYVYPSVLQKQALEPLKKVGSAKTWSSATVSWTASS